MKKCFVSKDHYLTNYKNVSQAVKATGIATNTVNKYMDTDKKFKGYKFYSKCPPGTYMVHGKGTVMYKLDLSDYDIEVRDQVIAMLEFTLADDPLEINTILLIADQPFEKRNRYIRKLAQSDCTTEDFANIMLRLSGPECLDYKMDAPMPKYKDAGGCRFSGPISESIWRSK